MLKGGTSIVFPVKKTITVDELKQLLHTEGVLSRFWDVIGVDQDTHNGVRLPLEGKRKLIRLRDGDVLWLTCSHKSEVLLTHTTRGHHEGPRRCSRATPAGLKMLRCSATDWWLLRRGISHCGFGTWKL